jgi:hypothetical protein
VIDLEPCAENFAGRAGALLRLDQPDRAETDCRKAIQLDEKCAKVILFDCLLFFGK